MLGKWIEYQVGGQNFKGYLAYDENDPSPKPAVVIAHAWKGQDDFARKKAELMVELGYVGFAADLYGDGKTVETNDEAAEMMMPLFTNRKVLRERIEKAYYTAAGQGQADENNMGAMGFCFGGLTVLELLRSGVNLKGTISFHGLLGDTLGDNKAETVPSADRLHGSLLILHGYNDPMVSQEDIVNTQKEFSKAEVDWQMHIYGSASHAFTNPNANDPESGLLYHAQTEKRSLMSMRNFFSEVFQ